MQNANLIDLKKSITELNCMPERFREYEKEPWYSQGVHIMPVDNYCVLYILDKIKALVTIIRVMYDGRDIETQLMQYTNMYIAER